MRKFFTLCIALLAMVFYANAQTPFFSEGFEGGTLPTGWTLIDADSDGDNWEHSSTAMGSGYGHNGSDYCMISKSYDNNSGALTPDNWLITPAITLTANSILKFYVCAQDANYAAEHYGVFISTTNATSTSAFTMLNQWTVGTSKAQSAWEEKTIDLSAYTGQTVYIAFRHWNVTDMFYLDLDDVTLTAAPTTPTITADPVSIAFPSTIAGNTSAASTSVIMGFNLTTGITASTSAPFEVSADGTAYSATATLATTGGTLYVRYSPTVPGSNTDSVVLSSTGAPNTVISVSGNAVDCSNYTYPIFEDFSADLTPCWQIVLSDPNNTNTPWVDASGVFVFSSFDEVSSNDYVEYLISPELQTTSSVLLSFDYEALYIDETFHVGYSTTTSDISAFTWGNEITAPAATASTLYESFPAGTKYVAIKYTSEYLYYLTIDNLTITDMPTTPVLSINTTSLDFGSISAGSTKELSFPITAIALASDLTITTAAPFEVSANGTTYGTTATIPQNAGVTNTDIYVRYAPTAPGSHTGNVTLTSGTLSHTVALTGIAIDCSNPISGFWLEDFEDETFPPSCWDLISNNSVTWTHNTQSDGNGVASCTYTTDAQDEKLITPRLDLSGFTTPTLGFKVSTNYTYICTTDPDETANLQVLVSTDGGTTWSAPVFDLCDYTEDDLTSWEFYPFVVSLSNYAGQSNVKLMFNYTGVYGCQIILDNVNLLDINGVNEVRENSVSVYPNPVNQTLNINATSNISKIEVFNTLGQKVMTVSASDDHAKINTSNLSKGMYLLKLHTDNGIVNQKFTVAR